MPRWFDDDGLLMQNVRWDPNWNGIHIHSAEARKMPAMVREDFDWVRQ